MSHVAFPHTPSPNPGTNGQMWSKQYEDHWQFELQKHMQSRPDILKVYSFARSNLNFEILGKKKKQKYH